jgi:hypothetical protein
MGTPGAAGRGNAVPGALRSSIPGGGGSGGGNAEAGPAGSVISVSLMESARPDLNYVRSQGREGFPMGCGECAMCEGGPSDPYREERRRVRLRFPEAKPGRAAKDPRFAWLPP